MSRAAAVVAAMGLLGGRMGCNGILGVEEAEPLPGDGGHAAAGQGGSGAAGASGGSGGGGGGNGGATGCDTGSGIELVNGSFDCWDGTTLRDWQYNPNALDVSEELESVLSGSAVRLVGIAADQAIEQRVELAPERALQAIEVTCFGRREGGGDGDLLIEIVVEDNLGTASTDAFLANIDGTFRAWTARIHDLEFENPVTAARVRVRTSLEPVGVVAAIVDDCSLTFDEK